MKKLAICIFVLIAIISCNDDPLGNDPEIIDPVIEEPSTIMVEQLTGLIQKGPFNNGTSISISELDTLFNQTGRIFKSETNNNFGGFELSNIELESKFVLLEADGFYYNECTGENSEAPIILTAIAEVSDTSNININLLSHLEKDRVLKLVADGVAFSEAKAQAQQEILKIFELDDENASNSEMLDITKEGDANAKLLAISAILQNGNSTAELSKLIADLKTDLYEDGLLSNDSLGRQLITQANAVNMPNVRLNLENKCKTENLQAEVSDFENCVGQFIANTSYEVYSLINYPDSTDYGKNILAQGRDIVVFGEHYSMSAIVDPVTTCKVIMRGSGWYYMAMPDGPIGWTISAFNANKQEFVSKDGVDFCDLKMIFGPNFTDSSQTNIILIEVFEGETEVPTFTKTLTVVMKDYSQSFNILENGVFGENLLAMTGDTLFLEPEKKYSLDFEMYEEITAQSVLTFEVKNNASITIDENDIENYIFDIIGDVVRLGSNTNVPQQYVASVMFNGHGEAEFFGIIKLLVAGGKQTIFVKENIVIVW